MNDGLGRIAGPRSRIWSHSQGGFPRSIDSAEVILSQSHVSAVLLRNRPLTGLPPPSFHFGGRSQGRGGCATGRFETVPLQGGLAGQIEAEPPETVAEQIDPRTCPPFPSPICRMAGVSRPGRARTLLLRFAAIGQRGDVQNNEIRINTRSPDEDLPGRVTTWAWLPV
jgi:hypothetical protein